MFLSVENIKTLNSKKFISEEAFEKDFKIHPQKGDILMTRIGDIGTANVVQSDEPVAYYVSLALLKPIGIESNFLATSIATPFVQDGLWRRTLHIAFPKKINKNEIAKVEINIPSLKEQIKIGAFFKQLDNTIALHQDAIQHQQDLKKAMLQKLFPVNGARIPTVRFATFKEEWEQRKLGESSTLITKGTTPKDKSGNGEVNFVKVENITNGLIKPISKISNREHDGYLKRSRLKARDILFSIAGTLGRTAIVDESILPANTNQALAIIRGYEFDTYFLITSLAGKIVKDFIRKNPTIGAQPNLSLEQIGNLIISTPKEDEQKQIGVLFKQLDNTIALHQDAIHKLQLLKQSLLQKMFVN